MLNLPNSISFVIQNNAVDNLPSLLTSLTEQKQTLNCQINSIVLSSEKFVKQDNFLTNIVDKLQSIINNKIGLFNNENNVTYADYQDLKAMIKSDLTIFIQTKYLPQQLWLKSIVSEFTNPDVNIVAGNVIEANDRGETIANNMFDNLCLDTPQQYLQAWQKQTANLAVRTEFLHKLNNYNLVTNNQNRNACFCRILRELESEIVYNPNAKVVIN